ncbi:facilitated trehalose transporter Tret1-like isoform X6 [Pieris brassicae]|uniref:facilitated trehalose transporter Tret1-like isoform X6 n=1 Tax=Pieris brassicae TaxID=7116 RepID=UPI001E65FE10|nr:facilitated trehalose transporter Tret1-like isoform X6 [Pieris brassicae]
MCSVSETSSRSVQYLAGLSVSFAFTFTGAVLSWPSPAIPKFKNGEANVQITDEQSSWVVALCPLGALLGCYFGQVLNEKVGRRRTILASVLPGLIGALLILFTKTPWLMCVARSIIGVGNGITAVK